MQNSSFPAILVDQHSSLFGFVLALSFVWRMMYMKEIRFEMITCFPSGILPNAFFLFFQFPFNFFGEISL